MKISVTLGDYTFTVEHGWLTIQEPGITRTSSWGDAPVSELPAFARGWYAARLARTWESEG